MKPTHYLLPKLPIRLEGLTDLAANFWWAWNLGEDSLRTTIDEDIWHQIEKLCDFISRVIPRHYEAILP